MIRVRIFAIRCGYGDSDDLDALRTDPAGDTERSRPIAVVLRSRRTPCGIEVRAHLRRLLRRIRTRWPPLATPTCSACRSLRLRPPKTRILFRGDGHDARAEAMAELA